MKKNLVSKIVFLILAILLIAMIIMLVVKKPKDLTINMYKNICENKNYTFSMEEEGSSIKYSLIIAKKDNTFSINSIMDSDNTTTLVEEDIAYYILHSNKEYYLYDSNQIDADILKEDLSGIEGEKYTKGYEKINGKNYYYEEYENITTFIMWLNYDEQSSIKTRFYFENNQIAYIKTIVNDTEEELLKTSFSNEVNNNLFEIPDDYAEILT